MKWDDIQIHFSSTDSDVNGACWIEGNINGGKAEQKGVELNGTWYATDQLNFDVERLPGEPRVHRGHARPELDRGDYIAKGWTLPVSPKEKYWASVEYTFPDFLPMAGDFWTRFSYTYQGKTWDSLGRDRGLPQRPTIGRVAGVPDPGVEVRHASSSASRAKTDGSPRSWSGTSSTTRASTG